MRFLLLLLPALLPAQTPAPHKTSAPGHKAVTAAPVTNFKESGSPDAPVTIDLYTDYQCPSCRVFYLDKLPALINDFVQTGKVRLIHRDFPLPMHQFGPLAARYANAAGEIGRYDLVSKQLFQTQPEWSQNGNVDAQVTKVLPPGEMQQVRELVKSDPRLEETVKRDTAQGNADGLTETPFMVISGPHGSGKREKITGIYGMPYSVLKTYLDQKVGK
ncbi:MAG: thioredoxin domain-containing protein [Bryobacteraceae bacterium]